jgi:hypothetical protein
MPYFLDFYDRDGEKIAAAWFSSINISNFSAFIRQKPSQTFTMGR